MGLDKSIMIYFYYSIFTALRILCDLPIHLSLLLHPTHQETTNLFYCLHSFAFSRMSYSWNHTLCSFSIWLLSLSNMHLSFLHVLLSRLDTSFLLSTEIYSIIWMYHSLFIHSPTERYLCCFQALVIKNKTVINIHVPVFVWT